MHYYGECCSTDREMLLQEVVSNGLSRKRAAEQYNNTHSEFPLSSSGISHLVQKWKKTGVVEKGKAKRKKQLYTDRDKEIILEAEERC